MLAWARAKKPSWAPITLYGLAGSVLILGCIAEVSLMHYTSLRTPIVEQGNVESLVRKWIDNFHLSSTKLDDSASSFALLVGLRNGTPIVVRCTKDFSHYITIQGTLTVSPDDSVALAKLPSIKRDEIRQQMILEGSRQRIVFSLLGNPLTSITVERRIPITPSLSENAFINGLDEVDNALLCLRESFATSLANAKK